MNYLKPTEKKINPEQNTNVFCALFFTHTKDIFAEGCKRGLAEDDIYQVPPSHRSQLLGNRLEKEWKNLVNKNKATMSRLMLKCFGIQYLLFVMSFAIPMTTTFFQPKLIKKFVLYFKPDRGQQTRLEACVCGGLLIVMAFINNLYINNLNLRVQSFGFKIRAGISSLIYRKVLKLEGDSTGKIITLITRDINDIEESILKITQGLRDLIKFVAVCILLYTEIGWMFLSLVVITLVIISIDLYFAVLVKKFKRKTLEKSDKRYQAIKEVLSAIRPIKCYCWYNGFKSRISKFRKDEVRYISKMYLAWFIKLALSESLFNASLFILMVSLIFFKVQFNSGILFLMMSSLNSLSVLFRATIPTALFAIAKLVTVLTRIGNFLRSVEQKTFTEEDHLPKISLINVDIDIPNQKLLQSINFEIEDGLTAVTGSTGSGKSLLVKVLAKQYHYISGCLNVSGSISYASQEPWLFPSTIRQNILFGNKFDENRYLKVLRVCALFEDLQSFKKGDSTIVADQGKNLSGGQQARINLARAVYNQTDIYLLDDCLSNLDVIVSDFIVNECFKKFLGDKIVIIVTNNPTVVKACNQIILLKNGTVEFHTNHSSPSVDKVDTNLSLVLEPESMKPIYSERKESGKIERNVYQKYVEINGGFLVFVAILILYCFTNFLKRYSNKMESNWIGAEETIFNNSSNTKALETRYRMLWLVPTLVTISAVFSISNAKLFLHFIQKGSLKVHKLLFDKVVNASMAFFDTHLIGNVLNRFSEDILYSDEKLLWAVSRLIYCFVELSGIMILLATVNFTFLVACLGLTFLIAIIRHWYLKTGRTLKRLEFSTRSPLIGHINATITGLSTIAVSKKQAILQEEFDRYQDVYISASYMFLCCERTFYFLVGIFGVIFVSIVVVLFLSLKDTPASNVGLVLSQLGKITLIEYMFYHLWTCFENYLIAIERILEYTKQKQENQTGSVFKNWSPRGEIQFDNVHFSYHDETLVLRDLNLVIKAKSKVGLIGRTGSGKTSLISILLRLYPFQGKIFLDCVDISTLPLEVLRSKITVIFQEPYIFTGTLRDNVDPGGRFNDEQIWQALNTVNLSSSFKSLSDEIGSLSAGQKQLICLSRALICKNKIVVLDESTANVDLEIESRIHKIVNENFVNSTVIIITHKLRHVLEYDQVVVLDKGTIIETGRPLTLLENQNSMFYKMFKKE